MMMAITEKCRIANGRRPFASGGATSGGIEDLWTFGTETIAQLESLIEDFLRIHAIELGICFTVGSRLKRTEIYCKHLEKKFDFSRSATTKEIISHLVSSSIPLTTPNA
jgi:histidine ammonia-lyase